MCLCERGGGGLAGWGAPEGVGPRRVGPRRVGGPNLERWGPEGWGPEGRGAKKGWAPKGGAPRRSAKKGWAPKGGDQKDGAQKGGGPKISRFFFFPLPPQFSFFLLSLGGPFVEFWWCFRRPEPENVHVWALGLSCETPAATPDRAAGARTRQPENSKRAHFRAPALQKSHQNSTKGPPRERDRNSETVAGEGKKNAKFWAVQRRGGPAEGWSGSVGPGEGGPGGGGPGLGRSGVGAVLVGGGPGGGGPGGGGPGVGPRRVLHRRVGPRRVGMKVVLG